MSLRGRWRKFVNAAMLGVTALFAITTVSVLFFILGYLVYHGGKNVNWDFFTRLPAPVGEAGGGMANAIVGTAKLLFVALVIGAPVGIFSGVYLSEFGGKASSFAVRYTADLLNGVPSIVIGIFAYAIIVVRAQHFSTLAGGFALGIMMIPIIVRSTEQFLKAVPRPLREGAMALGASKWRTVLTVVVPAAASGIMTGVMLALARIAGETAPLLFTAFSNRYWSPGFNQPIASLPVMIYTYAIGPYKDWHEQAWTAGLVLLGLVLVLNVATRLVFARKMAAFR
ncbi:MAG TPA: phosphate ABC transporter permease PstA [Candidatus Acidoferrales bacterium]|nr:phosphate ABC transporter permease PstA [Candidatus Acidoferrales bacterium]